MNLQTVRDPQKSLLSEESFRTHREKCPSCICGRSELLSLAFEEAGRNQEKTHEILNQKFIAKGFNRVAPVESKTTWTSLIKSIKSRDTRETAYELFERIRSAYGIVIIYPGSTEPTSDMIVIDPTASFAIQPNENGVCKLLQQMIQNAVSECNTRHPDWFTKEKQADLWGNEESSILQMIAGIQSAADFREVREALKARRIFFTLDGSGKINFGHIPPESKSFVQVVLKDITTLFKKDKSLLVSILEQSDDSFL